MRNGNDDVWKGYAGNAFRTNFDATLAQDLDYAQSSLEKAVSLIQEWHSNLVSFQETARGLETEAAEARGQHAKATAKLAQAKSNPDLALANTSYSDAESLAAAQSRLDTAIAAVRTATAAVDEWQATINAIVRRAHDLESIHDSLARRIAAELDASAKAFAPSPPDQSIWDRITDAIKGIGEYISDHKDQIHDVLAGISAVTGLLALVTPPPASAVLAVIALASGAGALAIDFMKPEVQQAIGDFTSDAFDGQFNGDALKTIGATVGMDSLAVIPGIGGLVKGGKALWQGAEFSTAITAFTEGAQAPSILAKNLDHGLGFLQSMPVVGNVADSAVVGLQDLSQVSKLNPGSALAGMEVFLRSAKAGSGLVEMGNVVFGD
ncbi:hypothetical protein ACL02S_17240 [Nocardia sp. 004]|uniref:hypothetical protein n=1 Tax=Nocardia sp. 004 TaxID=3385978 RepID=UPI0039A1F85A